MTRSRSIFRFNHTFSHQGGAAVIATLLAVCVITLILYVSILLTPKYLEYFTVSNSLQQVAHEVTGDSSVDEIRNVLQRYWQIETIRSINYDEIDILKMQDGYELVADYQVEIHLIGNVSLLLNFSKTVDAK